MFDDGNRMPEMRKKCEVYINDRLLSLLHSDPDPSAGAIAECARVAVQDFWLLHTGERARYLGTSTEESNPREED